MLCVVWATIRPAMSGQICGILAAHGAISAAILPVIDLFGCVIA